MSEMDRVEDILSVDHRCRDEIKQWQETGDFPNEIVRQYKHDGEKHKDVERMTQIGYTVVHEELTERLISAPESPSGYPTIGNNSDLVNNSTEGLGGSLFVTYRRKSDTYGADDGSNDS